MVTAVKPRTGGGVYVGDTSSATLPTSATATISGFTSLGYISDAGVTRAIQKDVQTVKAWGGATVAVLGTGKTETFQFKVIDVDNLKAAGLAFGSASGSLASGMTVTSTSDADPEYPYVFNTVLAGGVLQRICIPRGVVTAVGNVVYKDNEVSGYDLTITALEDSSGNTAYEYLINGTTGETGTT